MITLRIYTKALGRPTFTKMLIPIGINMVVLTPRIMIRTMRIEFPEPRAMVAQKYIAPK